MRRLLVVLGLVCAMALLCVLALRSADVEPVEPAAPEVAAPEPESPLPEPMPTERRRVRVAPEIVAPAAPGAAQEPPKPLASGRLQCAVRAPYSATSSPSCRLTVLWPTGEEIAAATVSGDATHTFDHLPHEVPLVLRVSAAGFLTGLCCDVEIPENGLVTKSIALVAAPTLNVHVVLLPRRSDASGVSVELLQGGGVVASGVTSARGFVTFEAPAVGQMRLRLSDGPLGATRESLVEVWPSDAAIEHVVEVVAPTVVEVAVIDARGRPAPGISVWLVGELSPRRALNSDHDGLVVFRDVDPTNELTVVARAPGGTVASAAIPARSAPTGRVTLLLAPPAAIEGDVVDEGGSVIVGATVDVVVRPGGDVVTAKSDDTGRFTTGPLPAGLAEIVVRRDGFLDWRAAAPVEIRAGLGGSVRARMKRVPTGRVFVSVRDEHGAGLGDAEVFLHPSKRTMKTSADGTCHFDDVPVGADQTAFARRRGFRASRASAVAPATVRIVANRGVDAEIRLERRDAQPGVPGDDAVTGTVLDPALHPIVGAAVECGAARGFTRQDGSFRLDGILMGAAREPVEFRVLPGPGLLEPFRCTLDPDGGGLTTLGQIRLQTRPYARIAIPAAPVVSASSRSSKSSKTRNSTKLGDRAAPAVWFASNHPDVLLGARHDAFEPIACISYDGTWLHLPPADDWRTDGRCETFLAFATPRGLVTATAAFTLAPDVAARLAPQVPLRGSRCTVDARSVNGSDAVVFRQLTCATLFDPHSIHSTTGETLSPVDPFASLTRCRTFEIDRPSSRETVDDLAAGRWLVTAGKTARGEITLPGDGAVTLGR